MEAQSPPFLLTSEQKCYVRQCVDVIITVAELYGFDTTGWSRKGTYDHWINCATILGDPMKFVKWKIAAFYSYHKNQTLPPSILTSSFCEVGSPDVLDIGKVGHTDHPGILLGGRGYQFIRNVLKRQDPELFESFITSILYSKKGMPRPGKNLLRLAELKAFEKLTSPPVFKPDFLLDWGNSHHNNPRFEAVESYLSKDTVIAQIWRTCDELFHKVSYTTDDRLEPFFPSTSANYNNTRSLGGVIGDLKSHPWLLKDLETKEKLIQLIVMEKGKKTGTILTVDDMKLREKFTTLYTRISEEAFLETPLAKPLALAEALKTRVISKGPPLLYTMLKPLQKKLWSTLKDNPCFSLIGQPVTADYVQRRMGKLKENQKFLSVDYTDATNEMFSFCSEAATTRLSDLLGLTFEESHCFERALTGHIIEHNGIRKPQSNGQLMGSIVSFPILCIVNAAICRWTLELAHGRHYTLTDAPLAINGDDAILKLESSGMRLWEKIGSFCGLSPSIGKVYISDTFLNINSTTYQYKPDFESYTVEVVDKKSGLLKDIERTRSFFLTPYINMGLLLGLKRSGMGNTMLDTGGPSFGSRSTELINSAPANLREKLMGKFIHINKAKLTKFNLPWFIPENLGGIGLPSIGRFTACDKDLRLARKIYENPKVFKLPARPNDVPWQTWKYACKRFPEQISMMNNDLGEFLSKAKDGPDIVHRMMSLNTVRGLACVEALFREPLEKLFIDSGPNAIKKQGSQKINVPEKIMAKFYSKTQSVWKKALLSEIKMPEPFNPTKFPITYSNNDLPLIFHLGPHSFEGPLEEGEVRDYPIHQHLTQMTIHEF